MDSNTRIKEVTTSMVRTFKECRRRFYFEYIAGLKPLETPKPLEIGTLYHYGLELLLQGKPLMDSETGNSGVFSMMMQSHRANAESKIIDFDPINCLVAIEMVKAFYSYSGYKNWSILSVEKSFSVSTGYAKRLLGKIDGLINVDSHTLLLEHKTTSQFGEDYLHNLLWDEQSTNYLYAYNRLLEDGLIDGSAAEGVFYCIVEKPALRRLLATPEASRKYKADGSLYANQRDRDESDDEYIARVRDWYAEKCRVHTHVVIRTPGDIAEQIGDVNLVIRDMTACEREETYYRNPAACRIFTCPFQCKCLDNQPETDALFMLKVARNEELQ